MSYRWAVVCFVVIALSAALAAQGIGIDFMALRVSLPLGRLPALIGVDVGMKLTIGWGIASLLLSPDGRTILLTSYEYPLGTNKHSNQSLVRIDAGLFYFDLDAFFPSPLFGAGLSYRYFLGEDISIGVTGDILYPLALGPPLITLGTGWYP